jgi:hypothetical protein
MSDSKKTSFLASFPPIQGAIKTDGSGGGMRIQLDIPENQIEHSAWLISMRQQVLRVTIEIEQDEKEARDKPKTEIKRSSARRKPANP